MKTITLARGFLNLIMPAALLVLPLNAGAAAYSATGTAELFSSATGWTAQPVSGATTTIYLNRGGQTFTCTNDVPGPFILNNFTRQVGGWTIGAINGASFEFVNNGSIPCVLSNATATAGLNLNAPVQLDNNLIVDGGATVGGVNLSGPVSGVGGIIKNKTNTLTLSGAIGNTFSGVVTINAGQVSLNKFPGITAIAGNVTVGIGSAQAILFLSTNSQIADTSILTFNGSGATAGIFKLNNQFDTIGGLASASGAGIVENNGANAAATLTLNVSGADQTFSGILQDSDGTVTGARTLSLTKTGPNAQILTGANTYTGNTTIQAGSLTLSGSGSIANSANVSVWSGATLNVLPAGFTVNAGNNLAGSGLVTGGTVEVASGGSLTPGTNGTAGTLTLPVLTMDSGCTNVFYFSPATNGLVNVTTSGGLTINGGAINLYVTNSATPATALGTYNLFQYVGVLNGAGVAALSVANPQPGLTYTFGASGGYVQLTIGAGASTAYWNVDASASWNNTADWTSATIPNFNGASANFGGGGTPITAPRTVTLDGDETVLALNFNSAQSFTISPGTPSTSAIILDNSGTPPTIINSQGSHTVAASVVLPLAGLSVNDVSGATLALTGAISGNGGLTNSGAGTLTLAGNNTYTGGTVLNAGTLSLNSSLALGATAGAFTINGGTLDNSSGAAVALANNNPINANVNFTFLGTTNLNLGAGLVTLTNTGNFTITVSSNILTLGGAIVSTTTNTILNKVGNGTLSLAGNSTITNAIVAAGTLSLNAAGGALPGGSTIFANGGVLDVAQADTISTLNCAGSDIVSGVGTLTVTNFIHPNIAINQSNIIGCSLAGSAPFLKTGQGVTILSAANSYSGGTTLSGANSKIFISGSGTLGNTSSPLALTTAGATPAVLDLGGTTQTVGAASINGAVTNGTLIASSFDVTNGVAYATLAGSGVGLTMDGASGAFTLVGANTYTGNTLLNGGGTLLVNGSINAASAVAVNAGTLGGSGTIGGTVTEATGANIAPGSGTNNVGTLTIGGDLNLNGGGSLTLAMTNTSNAAQIIVGGNLNPSGVTTIVLPNPNALPNGNYTLLQVTGALGGSAGNFSVTSVAPKTYNIVYQAGSPNTVILQVSGTPSLTWSGDGSANQWNTTSAGDWLEGGNPTIFANGNAVTFDNSSTNLNVNVSAAVAPAAVTVSSSANYTLTGTGSIGGSATLTKSGSSTLTLGTANSFTGATTVNGGVLAVSADNNLGAAPGSPTPGQLVLNGGSLSATANLTLHPNRGIALGSPTGAGSGTINVATNQTLTVAAVIADNTGGAGTLNVNPTGAGTNVFTGANTYSGGTILTLGTLTLQNNQSAANGSFYIGTNGTTACHLNIAAAATVSVASGNTFQAGEFSTAVGGSAVVDTYGSVTNNGVLQVRRYGAVNINNGGNWLQNNDMTVQGAGNWTAQLNVNSGGTFTYTGASTIKLNNNNGNFYGTNTINVSGLFSTGVGFENQTTTTGGNTGSSQLTIGGGTLKLTADVPDVVFSSSTTPILCAISNNATIDTDVHTASVTVPINGSGNLIKAGAGTLTLAATNGYAGNTTVSNGTLVIQQPSLATNSTVTVASGGVLKLDFSAATNQVGALVLNGVSKPAGVYNSSTDPVYLTGAGSLLVVPVSTAGTVGNPQNVRWVGGNIIFSITNSSGTYRVQSNTNLANAFGWLDVATNMAPFSFTNQADLPARFYRTVTP